MSKPMKRGSAKGRTYRQWHSSAVADPPNIVTRQQTRAKARKLLWEANSGANALRDDNGIMLRRVHRAISREQFKRASQNIQRKLAA